MKKITIILLMLVLVSGCFGSGSDPWLDGAINSGAWGKIVYDGEREINTDEQAKELFEEFKQADLYYMDNYDYHPETIELVLHTQTTNGGIVVNGWALPKPYAAIWENPENGDKTLYGLLIGKDGKIYSFAEGA